MFTYLLKRFLAMIPTLIGISFVTFLIILLAPGDPVATSMGGGGGGGAEASAGGGGADLDRQADAIKAKKKMLGMLEEHRVAMGWDAMDAVAAREREISDKYVQVAEMQDTAALGDFEGWTRSLALSTDGATLYVGTKKGEVAALDTGSGELIREFPRHEKAVWALALSPDGGTLVSADSDGVLRLNDTATGDVRVTLDPLGKPVRDLVYLPDGSGFVSACDDSVIRLHDGEAGRVLRSIPGHTAFVSALAVSRDGKHLWSGGYDRKLREWDVDTWAVARVIAEHPQAITDIAVSPDESLLATACEDKLVRLFGTDPGGEGPPLRAELAGHYRAVDAVAFHKDGRTLFSGGRDETLRTWDVEQKRQTAQVPENSGKIHGLAPSPDGETLWSVAESWRKTPAWKQYWRWASNVAVLDFGRSFTDDRKVTAKMWEPLKITVGLNVIALLIIYLISVPIGVIAAVKRAGWFDRISSVVVFLLWSIPSFWLATMLIQYFSSELQWNWFPSIGLHDSKADDMSYLPWLADWGMHLVLPMIVLTYGGFASLSRYARTSMLETIAQDFVRTARAKGLPERVVVFKHALRNSLIAIVTLLGNLLPAMIGGSVIVEFIFNIRGMGLLAFEAILQRDYPVVMAVTTFSALLTLLGVLLSDVLYSVVDPRITHK